MQYFSGSVQRFCVQHCMSFLILVFVILFTFGLKLKFLSSLSGNICPIKKRRCQPWTAIKTSLKCGLKTLHTQPVICVLFTDDGQTDDWGPKIAWERPILGQLRPTRSLTHLHRPLTCLSRVADAFHIFFSQIHIKIPRQVKNMRRNQTLKMWCSTWTLCSI